MTEEQLKYLKYLTEAEIISALQQQNKHLIEALNSISTMEAPINNLGIAFGIMKKIARTALQQIEGNK